ncbi:hypothetical protein [Marinactinospora thermotolerans]|nr:hypothetical protein [Marinactinospora thermotolerans]
MELTITVCDVDRQPGRATKRYTLQRGEREVTLDLREEHAGPIEALLDGDYSEGGQGGQSKEEPKRQPVAKKAAATSRRRRGPKVVTLEEIEASKKS